MTVERFWRDFGGQSQKEAQTVLNTLKEVTGVSDSTLLGEALEASKIEDGKYDLSRAVNILMDENSPYHKKALQQQQQEQELQQAVLVQNQSSAVTGSGVIDLTNDGSEKEDDLQKAIALSLKEQQKGLGGQVSMEDQDISRVVEASLAESKAVGTKRKRGEVWQDPLNPNDRKRNGDWPVGLKNVGNTCWFSSVIQSLFHLPVFRRLVLNFLPQRNWSASISETKESNLHFMHELRKLFALMLCSKRKYVDPSHALEELKEAFPDSSSTDSQQDVSEFSHKLLEWLEEAFKLDESDMQMQTSSFNVAVEPIQEKRNPMLDLFYGHFRSEGQNEGRTFSNEEAFGQYPLQVNGFNDIHESLEAAMAQEIESTDVMSKSGQESWFTQLPPVLLFELSRFQFNQQLGRPEKIHNKLEFPELIYMDRYMEYNKHITRSKREQVRLLKEERDKLKNRLEKYLNYGSGSKRVPLSDVLQYTLEFVESKHSREPSPNVCCEDVEMASPASAASVSNESPCNSPNKVSIEMLPASQVTSHFSSCSMLCNTVDSECETVQELTPSAEKIPSPQHVSEVELRVLQSCLRRWRTEIEGDVKELQDHINKIDNVIKEIYSEPALQQKPYRLHAVLVHEGQAASGHYWAYVFSPRRNTWLKFNDITVTDVSLSELQKESIGGHHYASAYCLMYVDVQRPELFEETKESELTGPDCLDGLPDDLQKYVNNDNQIFLSELNQWDLEQSKKKDFALSINLTNSGGGDTDSGMLIDARIAPGESSQQSSSNLFLEHAGLVLSTTFHTVDILAKLISSHGPTKALEEAIRQEKMRIQRLARLPTNQSEDTRLQHIGVYIVMNSDGCDLYLQWSIIEQFAVPNLDEKTNGALIRGAASQKLESLKRSLNQNHYNVYTNWHEEYQKFRKVVTLFIFGVECYHNEKYDHALNYLTECCYLNSLLISKPPGESRGLNRKLLYHYRRQSALKLNEAIATKFINPNISEHDAIEALADAYEYIIPCMESLISRDKFASDEMAAEIIRRRWCNMLGGELSSVRQEKLQDFLLKLVDPSSYAIKRKPPSSLRITQLDDKFHKIMHLIIKTGEHEKAQKSD